MWPLTWNVDFQHLNIIAFTHDKNKRRIIESSAISHSNIIEQRQGFYKMSVNLSIKDHALSIYMSASLSVALRKTSSKPLGMLTLLTVVNPASVGQQLLAAAFRTSVDWSPLCSTLISWLTHSVDWSLCSLLLCPLLFCWLSFPLLWDLPSLVFFQSRGRSRAQTLCVGFVPKLTKGLSDWHLHTPTQRLLKIVSHVGEPWFSVLK